MAVKTLKDRCDNCRGADIQRCVAVCPGALMDIDPQTLRAYCRDQAACWDCLACVKACSRGALVPQPPYSVARRSFNLQLEAEKTFRRWYFTEDGEEKPPLIIDIPR